jgi:ClpP class serine protease
MEDAYEYFNDVKHVFVHGQTLSEEFIKNHLFDFSMEEILIYQKLSNKMIEYYFKDFVITEDNLQNIYVSKEFARKLGFKKYQTVTLSTVYHINNSNDVIRFFYISKNTIGVRLNSITLDNTEQYQDLYNSLSPDMQFKVDAALSLAQERLSKL